MRIFCVTFPFYSSISIRKYEWYKNFVHGFGTFQHPTLVGRRLQICYSSAEYITINPRFHLFCIEIYITVWQGASASAEEARKSCSKSVMATTVIKYILQLALFCYHYSWFFVLCSLILYTSNYFFFNFIRGVDDWNHDMYHVTILQHYFQNVPGQTGKPEDPLPRHLILDQALEPGK
jgi:hypothetical protein